MIDFWNFARKSKLLLYRIRISSRNIKRSIVCNNCLGGMLSHDYSLQFCSPFVNLMIPVNHFIEILTNINDIHKWDFVNITQKESAYPVGLLNSTWEVHFIHYKTYDEAITKWFSRLSRLDLDNLYIILVETASCTMEDLRQFDKLPFKNKIAVTHKPYHDIQCASCIDGYDGKNLNGELFWRDNMWGGLLYDRIDWINFLDLIKSFK